MGTITYFETEFTQNDFFKSIQDQIPSKIAMILGVFYGVIVVLGRLSKEWKQHKLNIQEIKKGRESLEQEGIRTKKQRKELDGFID
jgi:uncharacterized membrane protein